MKLIFEKADMNFKANREREKKTKVYQSSSVPLPWICAPPPQRERHITSNVIT